MLEPTKPDFGDGSDANQNKPAKEYNPTPAEGSPDFEPGTQDPDNPEKK